MFGVGCHGNECLLHTVHDAVTQSVLDRPRYPPRTLGLDSLPNHILVLFQELRRQAQCIIQQRLMPSARGEQTKHSRQQRGDPHRAQSRHDAAIDQLLHVVIAHHTSGTRQATRDMARETTAVLGL